MGVSRVPYTVPVVTPLDEFYTIYPERAEDVFNANEDWRQDSDGQAGGDIYASADGTSHASMRGYIDANKLRSFILYALGYASASNPSLAGEDEDPVYRLFRVNPPTHPKMPWLRVKSVTLREFGPRAGTPTEDDPNPEVPGTVNPDFPLKEYSMRPREAGEDFSLGQFDPPVLPDRQFYPFCPQTTHYEQIGVTVDFWQPRYPIMEDDDPAFDPDDESGRNVYWTTEPAVDLLALEGGEQSLLYRRETSASGPSIVTGIPFTSPPNEDSLPIDSFFKAPLGYLDPKLMDVANWVMVPTRYIFDENLIPTKILSVLGKTNSTAWFGYAPGTALFIGVAFEPYPWPIYSVNQHVVNMWSVKAMFKYYDPKRPDTVLPADTGKRGWVTYKWRDGLSYWATRFNGQDLYGSADFREIFRHRERPV